MQSERPNGIGGRTTRWIIRILIATTLAANAACAARQFFPGPPHATPLPFTSTDHPLQYYYGQLTIDFFRNRFAFWGYDPTFMAGYGKSIVFPTSGTLPDLVAILSGKGSAWSYNLISTVSAFLTPALLGLAAYLLARSSAAALVALLLATQWTWCSWPSVYIQWGMGPFILTSALSVLSASLVARWLQERSVWCWIAGAVLGTVAVILHPLSVVTLGLSGGPAYLVHSRRIGWRGHAAAWSIPAAIALFWTPWWLPAWILRDTYGTSAIGFVNENVRGRIEELLNGKFPEESMMLAGGLLTAAAFLPSDRRRRWCLTAAGLIVFAAACIGWHSSFELSLAASWPAIAFVAALLTVDLAVGLFRHGDSAGGLLLGGPILLFALAYFGGAFESLWRLQPGRFTQPLYALLVVSVSTGLIGYARSLRERPRNIAHFQTLTAALLGAISLVILTPRGISFASQFNQLKPLRRDIPARVFNLATLLRQSNDQSGRVLFEDRGRVQLGAADPFGSSNPSALLPLLAPGQYIGGPYLYTNLKTNFTQFGDRNFFQQPADAIQKETFEQYAALYNIQWMACWSKPMVRLGEAHPDYFQLRGRFGAIRLFKINREANWAISGRADVHAEPDRLTVSNAQADATGTLILSYHWIDTLRSEAAIRPVLVPGDPVPFIAVDRPESTFVIENRLF